MPAPRTKDKILELTNSISERKRKKKEKDKIKSEKIKEKKKIKLIESKEKKKERRKLKKEKEKEVIKIKKAIVNRKRVFILKSARSRFRTMDLRYINKKANNKRRYNVISEVCNSIKLQFEKNGCITRPVFPYMVVISCNGVVVKRDRLYSSKEKALLRIGDLYGSSSSDIVFPVMYTKQHGESEISECLYEYMILEKTDEKNPFVSRNEFGKFVEHDTNDQDWNICYIKQFDIEETFTVLYKGGKKENYMTYTDIYEDLIMDDCRNKLNIKRLMVLDNKLLIQFDDYRGYVVVLCKSILDSTRFYNMVKTNVKKDKIKTITFFGFVSESLKDDYFSMLSEHTGLSLKKIKELTHFPQNREIS